MNHRTKTMLIHVMLIIEVVIFLIAYAVTYRNAYQVQCMKNIKYLIRLTNIDIF